MNCAGTLDKAISTGAGLMLAPRQQWRISRAVYGPHFQAIWPPRVGATVQSVLHDCRRHIRSETSRGRERHWTFDVNRLIALRQAEQALLTMMENEGAFVKERA
jgi:hypothetical protein